jgi:hypothetical protein
MRRTGLFEEDEKKRRTFDCAFGFLVVFVFISGAGDSPRVSEADSQAGPTVPTTSLSSHSGSLHCKTTCLSDER